MLRIGYCWMLSPIWDINISTPAPKAQETLQKRDRKNLSVAGWNRVPWNHVFALWHGYCSPELLAAMLSCIGLGLPTRCLDGFESGLIRPYVSPVKAIGNCRLLEEGETFSSMVNPLVRCSVLVNNSHACSFKQYKYISKEMTFFS